MTMHSATPHRLTGVRAACVFSALALLGACDTGDSDNPLRAVRVASAQTPSSSAFEDATARALPAVVYIQVEARPRAMNVPLGPRQSTSAVPGPAVALVQPLSDSGSLSGGGYISEQSRIHSQR